ncbi:MAG TPA: hypothetical protein VF070_45720 [Streptosporangiaceae bacterium]
MSGGQAARPGATWLIMLLALYDRGEPPGAGADHARRTRPSNSRSTSP